MDPISNVKGVKFIHMNTRSLYRKIDELRLLYHDYDFICCSETWLDDRYNDAILHIDGMRIFRLDRKAKPGRTGVTWKNRCNLKFGSIKKKKKKNNINTQDHTSDTTDNNPLDTQDHTSHTTDNNPLDTQDHTSDTTDNNPLDTQDHTSDTTDNNPLDTSAKILNTDHHSQPSSTLQILESLDEGESDHAVEVPDIVPAIDQDGVATRNLETQDSGGYPSVPIPTKTHIQPSPDLGESNKGRATGGV